MSTGNYGPISYSQKKRMWEQHKYDTFNKISQDKSLMFNYFLINNDIFKMISPKDENSFRAIQVSVENKLSNFFFGSICCIAAVDIATSYLVPKFNVFGRFKATGLVFKYLVLPCLSYAIFKEYFMDQQQIAMYQMQQKYDFGFQDFMKANKIFERALAVDRLEELYQRRGDFDWRGIPELVDNPAKV